MKIIVGLFLLHFFSIAHCKEPDECIKIRIKLASNTNFKGNKWPNNRVFYKISSRISAPYRKNITEAFDVIQNETQNCVTFVERTNQMQYLKINKIKEGCFSNYGYNETGVVFMELEDYCLTNRMALLHETMHILGFAHMHQVPNRDSYVDIKWENIDEDFIRQFSRSSCGSQYDKYFPYDYDSVMHYPRDATFLK
ncbi:zinc metalloproteinase nas-7-like [Contarinia nasturtii]|uniref:zinc metalloproteinase nas-7-like n=1 Tax=Contarinia nasturtii TaxID=265458 RepID=UPI0012D49EB3|nr:zinc metalloproteinase nas-7-like [Contarinia nasturtii]